MPLNPGEVAAMIAITVMIRKAEDTEEITGVVVELLLADVGEACQGALPTTNAIKQLVRRVRKKVDKVPSNPKSLRDLVILGKYAQYSPLPGVFERFLLFNSGNSSGANRFLIFGRPRSVEILHSSEFGFGDGTFKITLSLFYLIFLIFELRFGAVQPLLYALLPNKTRYHVLFNV